MEKQDIRITKTKLSLANAMFTLLNKNNFKSITVNDLCTEAMVSRSTFYVHFEDKYALLHFCMATIRQQLFARKKAKSLTERLVDVLTQIQDNVKIFKNLLMVNFDEELRTMMRGAFHSEVSSFLTQKYIDTSCLPQPLEVTITFYASGITSSIMHWISQDMPYTIEEMAECLSQLMPLPLGSKPFKK